MTRNFLKRRTTTQVAINQPTSSVLKPKTISMTSQKVW